MRVVTRRTGISAELLRVWERRYGVVTPARTHTGRRLYSDAEIERLHLLYQATVGGRSIGLIATLATADLRELVRQDAEAELERADNSRGARSQAKEDAPRDHFLAEALAAVERFDQALLGAVLRRASVALPAIAFLDVVVSSLLERVATRVRTGTLRPVDGHLTTMVVRRTLEQTLAEAPPTAPRLLLATLTGESGEPGALIGAVAAASEGWSVTWLDSGVTADDITDAAKKFRARAVMVTLGHPVGDTAAGTELRRLRAVLPRSIEMVAYGSASSGYTTVLEEIGATHISDLTALMAHLARLGGKSSGSTAGQETAVVRKPRRIP
jgi:DNA-binding transcriptional MerR regulator